VYYGKGIEDDLGLGAGRQQPRYPIGTVAMYGPDDKTTTKIAAGVILRDGAEPILKRWVATDVTTNPKVQQEMKDFFLQHGVKSVAMSQGNLGCPHEEGEDFPHGASSRSVAQRICWEKHRFVQMIDKPASLRGLKRRGTDARRRDPGGDQTREPAHPASSQFRPARRGRQDGWATAGLVHSTQGSCSPRCPGAAPWPDGVGGVQAYAPQPP
jgi:hypothetical protein